METKLKKIPWDCSRSEIDKFMNSLTHEEQRQFKWEYRKLLQSEKEITRKMNRELNKG